MITIEQVENGCIIEDTGDDCLDSKIVVERTGFGVEDLDYTNSILCHVIDSMGLNVGSKHSTHRLYFTILPNDTIDFVEAIKDEFLWDGCEIKIAGEGEAID